jgi:hypothetical protein
VQHSKYPDSLEFDNIGVFVASKRNFDFVVNYSQLVDNQCDFLNILNITKNAYKHSIANSETHYRQGAKEPIIFAYYLYYNNIKKDHHEIKLTVEHVLRSYSIFLDEIIPLIKDYEITK